MILDIRNASPLALFSSWHVAQGYTPLLSTRWDYRPLDYRLAVEKALLTSARGHSKRTSPP